MTRTKSIIGALALCALSICAFAAANASAAKEVTAVTCQNVGGTNGKYNNSHCNTPQVAASAFETTELPLNTTTEVTAKTTEGSGEPVLRATLGGAAVTILCESSELIEAKIANTEPTAGKHTISTTAKRNTYTGCHAVLKSNETRFCAVEGITAPGGLGMISTTMLKGTSLAEHKVKVEPHEGELFTEFKILKKPSSTENECFFNNDVTVQVKGSVEGECNTTNHSHLTFTEANNGTALKANGATAKYLDTVGGNMAGEGTQPTVGCETFTS